MIVSNTTPLSSLLKIRKTHLLQALYGSLTIPPEVAAELDQAGPIHDGWREHLRFVRVVELSVDDPVKKLLLAELDPGEAAAIALARRLGCSIWHFSRTFWPHSPVAGDTSLNNRKALILRSNGAWPVRTKTA